jgi:hypothetical protein
MSSAFIKAGLFVRFRRVAKYSCINASGPESGGGLAGARLVAVKTELAVQTLQHAEIIASAVREDDNGAHRSSPGKFQDSQSSRRRAGIDGEVTGV